jgi:plasmid stability protein
MATLTIRDLDETLKRSLRIRAAHPPRRAISFLASAPDLRALATSTSRSPSASRWTRG